MHLRSVYAKLLAGFCAVLLLTVCLAALWSWWVFRGPDRQENVSEAEAQAGLIRMVTVQAMAASPDAPPARNARLADVLCKVAAASRARLWLEDEAGNVLVKTFDGPRPAYDVRQETASRTLTLLEPRDGEAGIDFFIRTPVDLGPWGRATLYAAFDEYPLSGQVESYFILGLAAIALLMAVFIVPVSRFITSPLRDLQDVVLGYAGGDLGRRFSRRRKDEIGDLGRSFDVMADSLERMIKGSRELVANVSHELRSPMARIRVSEELLRESLDRGADQDARRHMDGIRLDVECLDRLVGRILEFSRLDLREDGMSREAVDLSSLAEGVLDRYCPAMERKGLALGLDAAQEVVVSGDPALLESALTNLVDNAVKYSPEGGAVHVRCSMQDGLAAVRVTNTHAPLGEADLEAIFRPFYRVAGGGEPGHGLGLALVRRIAERHGGRVEACNTGQGLCIALLVPEGP